MRLARLLEQVEESAIAKKFSDFASAVNGLSDLLGQDNPPEDFVKSLGDYQKTIQYWQREIGSLQLSDADWGARRTPQMPASWNAARDLLTRGKLQRIAASIADLLKEPVSKDNTKVSILKERVNELRDLLTGIAAIPMSPVVPPA